MMQIGMVDAESGEHPRNARNNAVDRQVFYNDKPTGLYNLDLYIMSKEALLARRQKFEEMESSAGRARHRSLFSPSSLSSSNLQEELPKPVRRRRSMEHLVSADMPERKPRNNTGINKDPRLRQRRHSSAGGMPELPAVLTPRLAEDRQQQQQLQQQQHDFSFSEFTVDRSMHTSSTRTASNSTLNSNGSNESPRTPTTPKFPSPRHKMITPSSKTRSGLTKALSLRYFRKSNKNLAVELTPAQKSPNNSYSRLRLLEETPGELDDSSSRSRRRRRYSLESAGSHLQEHITEDFGSYRRLRRKDMTDGENGTLCLQLTTGGDVVMCKTDNPCSMPDFS